MRNTVVGTDKDMVSITVKGMVIITSKCTARCMLRITLKVHCFLIELIESRYKKYKNKLTKL